MIYEKVLSPAADRGMSISELEKKAGLSKASISKWKNPVQQQEILAKTFAFIEDFSFSKSCSRFSARIKSISSSGFVQYLSTESILPFYSDGMISLSLCLSPILRIRT